MAITFKIKTHTASAFVAALFTMTGMSNNPGPSVGVRGAPRQWGTGGLQIHKLRIREVNRAGMAILGGSGGIADTRCAVRPMMAAPVLNTRRLFSFVIIPYMIECNTQYKAHCSRYYK